MIALLLILTSYAQAPMGNFRFVDAVCDDLNIEQDQVEVACDIEKYARAKGVREPWFIKGLIANAYAESELDVNAVSRGKTSYGIFQLHIDGMGYGWSKEDMKDVKKSTNAIIDEAKSKGIYKKKMNPKSATAFLCKKVLRPKNIEEQIEKRTRLLEKLF
jgi:hypothetical protein